MAAKWNNEYIVADHKDLQASTMACDRSGQFILLAGRRCVAIIDEENPNNVVKKILRQSKWEVSSAQWNPHSHYSNIFAIASNQRTEILSWNVADLSVENTLRSHTRAVSDIDWHPVEPAWLATCSIDTFIHIWDIRDPRKPSMSLSAVVGASRCRWNKSHGNPLLASAHEGDIRIWDCRKVSSPCSYIAAHISKIHELDFSNTHEYQLASSSQDCTVKFFDILNPRVVENAIKTICPVWRAKFTPFGEGMTTTQLRRGENSILLWNMADLNNPVHSFVGHSDVVLEFDWKRNRHDHDVFQLITWSKDQSLRVWRVDSNLQKLIGFEPDNEQPTVYEPESDSMFVNQNSHIHSCSNDEKEIETGVEVVEENFRGSEPLVHENYMDISGRMLPLPILPDSIRLSNHKTVAASIAAAQAALTCTLSPSLRKKSSIASSMGENTTVENIVYTFSEEIEQIKRINGISVTDVDESQRQFTATVNRGNKHIVVIHISLPANYPTSGGLPNFHVGKGNPPLDPAGKSKIAKFLKQAATLSAKKGCAGIELALQQLINNIDQLTISEKTDTESSKSMALSISSTNATPYRLTAQSGHSFLQSSTLFGLSHHSDHNIPYPRSSGARFCSAGMLICFGRPSYLRRVSNKMTDSSTTPRSLYVNQNYNSNLGSHNLAVSSSSTPYGIIYPPVAQSISSFYNQDRRQKGRQASKTKNRLPSIGNLSDTDNKRASTEGRHQNGMRLVTIYDASGLMPLHQELGERYVFSDDIVWMSQKNAAIAAQIGRKDLHHVWSLVALLAVPTLTNENSACKDQDSPWAQTPFGRKLLHAIIDHYVKQRDIQTVAMLCCAFGSKCETLDGSRRKTESRNMRWTIKPGESLYHTIHPGDTSLDSWNVVPNLKQNRSNSWSDSLDDSFHATNRNQPLPVSSIFPSTSMISNTFNNGSGNEGNGIVMEDQNKDLRLLDPKFNGLFDNYRRFYADILFRWGLLEARIFVLKYLSTPTEAHRGVDFVTECSPCRQTVRGPQCSLCKRLLLNCVICRVVVKGSASFCLICGHGGHSIHIAKWFAEESVCPSGCGCSCLFESMAVLSV